ncbi:MAG TPA: crossover junction endodeoxyribonuclease RuvC [Candidatus Dormibacteraeota bacterium]|nr:crossover junction endodeoxyribonuclease RuvC [Candidatus Dormibacteraeota bacterium]
MLVLGLDPGLALSGYALIGGRPGALELLEAGCLRTAAGTAHEQRLAQLAREWRALLQTRKPAAVAVERLFVGRNLQSALPVAEARGVLLCGVAEAALPLHTYGPSEVKQAVSGNGAASKQQVARMVRLLLRGAHVPGPDDVTDACAVAICHHHSAGTRRAIARQVSG